MDLQRYQSSLLRLMTTGQALPGDLPYAHEVAASQRLAVVREVVAFWRSHGIARYCVLSSAWLKRSGRFDASIADFIAGGEFSPDVAQAGWQFLQWLACQSGDGDALTRAIARFEIALHETRADAAESRTLDWPCDPGPWLAALVGGGDLPAGSARPHRVTVSRSLPGGYAVEPID